jgi:hypothetical protein
VSLRYSRSVKTLLAAGLAASTIGVAALPAAAGTPRSSEWWMSSLSIRNAWPVSRGAGITVAVLSDGVDTQHPDLTGSRFITGPDYTGTDQSSGQYFGTVGTGIAGIIAAHGYGVQSQNGIIGAVPLASVLSVRVTLPAGDPLLSQASVAAQLPNAIGQGIRYAVSHGASVIDLPLDPGQAGISGSGATIAGTTAAAGGSAAEAAAVKFALSRNVVLVAPAGDDNLASDAPNYPAAYPGVIAVGAFNKDYVKAPWTSHQSYVTVTAAGEDMTVATNTGGFQAASSTVYASAVVTGIVAMLQSRFPGITVAQVRHALIKGTVFHGTGGATNGSGHGTVNADKALLAASTELTSRADRAGAHVTQATVATAPAAAATPAHPGLVHSIIRSGVVAGALLVVLLLLIALYVIRGRRRAARQRAAQPSGWSRDGATRHPRAGAPTTDADRMAAFFAAPVTAPPAPIADRPATDRPPAGRPISRGLRPSTAERVFSGSARPAPLGGDLRGSQPHAYAPWDVADAGSRPASGPASRAVAKRPAVSGAPPWEEAQPPEGDLPWATPAERSQAARQAAARATPAPARAPAPDVSPAPAPLPTRTSAVSSDPAGHRGQLSHVSQPRHASPAQPDQIAEPADTPAAAPFEPAATFEPRQAFAPRQAFEPSSMFEPRRAFEPARPSASGQGLEPAATANPVPGPAGVGPDGTFQPGKAFQAVAAHADFRRMAQRQHAGRPQISQPGDPFGPDQLPARPPAGSDFGGGPGLGRETGPGAESGIGAENGLGRENGFGRESGFGGGSGFGSPGDVSAPPDASDSTGGESPAGRLDWSRHEPASPDGPAAPDGPPRQLQVPGGPLPVRQPRRSAPPPDAAALSPSGSLWERNVEPADPPAESADPASRPIFVWNPAAGADSFPPEAAELTPKPRDWSLRGRHEGPAED